MQAKKSKWDGMRAIAVARQSQDKDGTGSNTSQIDAVQLEFDRVGLIYVDKLVLDGIPASAPAKLEAFIQQLFERKRTKNDFEVIAWQVEDRASRSGGEHGMWLEHEAKRHGLRVFFPGDTGPRIPHQAVLKVFKYEAAMDVSVSNGRRAAQSHAYAIKQGFYRTAGQTPVGCDRLYYDPEDNPKFLIHNLSNGRQEQRDFATGKVIGTYGTVGKKSHNRFKKQKNEYSLLYPGDREKRKVVRVIFYLRYKRGWRGMRIADFLNRSSVPSPKGKQWSQRQVQIIYENPAYTGCTYNSRVFSGRFFRRDKQRGFVALERDEIELVQKKTFAPKLQPMDEWDRIDQPHMYDYLPRDVRDLAIAAQAQMDQVRTDPNRPSRKPSAHPASLFWFSDKLRALQGETLIGTMSGPPGHKTPYYRHRKGKRGHRKGSKFNNLIPAKPLHDAVLGLLADVLEDAPDLRERLRQHVLTNRVAAHAERPDVAKLEEEREELQEKVATLAALSGAALKSARPQLDYANERLNAICEQIDAADTKQDEDRRPVEVVVNEAVRILSEARAKLYTLPSAPLRDLINRLVTDAVVDMETKAVELTIALPAWALQARAKKNRKNPSGDPENEDSALCLSDSRWSSEYRWTQTILIVAHCTYAWTRGSHTVPPCYQCRRRAA